MTLSEMLFPRTPGPVGSKMPANPSPQLLDFNGMDFEGIAAGDNGGRITFVDDPGGTKRTVVRMEIRQGDDADTWGGQRIEFDKYPWDQKEGESAWFFWDWYLGDGVKGERFIFPDTWCLMFQMFSQPDGSPPMAQEMNPSYVQAGQRCWGWNARTSPMAESGRRTIAPATLGGRHFFALQINPFSEGSQGHQAIWHGFNALPDVTKPPADQRTQNNIYKGFCHPAVHMYRGKSTDPAQYPQVAYFGRFVRAATFARALELSGWAPHYGGSTPPPFVADVPAAIVETKQTLDWMRRTKTTGGLGYSVARVQTTHSYKALLDLGGVWP